MIFFALTLLGTAFVILMGGLSIREIDHPASKLVAEVFVRSSLVLLLLISLASHFFDGGSQ